MNFGAVGIDGNVGGYKIAECQIELLFDLFGAVYPDWWTRATGAVERKVNAVIGWIDDPGEPWVIVGKLGAGNERMTTIGAENAMLNVIE